MGGLIMINQLEKLLEESQRIGKADLNLYNRKSKLSKQLRDNDYRGTVFISEGVVWKVTQQEDPKFERVGELEGE
jgi:hypothetical protein